jgi:hypothetical protein
MVTGMAFTLFNGRAAWDYSGVRRAAATPGATALVTALPNSVTAGSATVLVSAIDSGDGAPLTGTVLRDGQNVAAVGSSFAQQYAYEGPGSAVTFVVSCPGYPDESISVGVSQPKDPTLITVPDLVGASRHGVEETLRSTNLDVEFKGSSNMTAFVAHQSPQGGAQVQPRSTLTLYMQPGDPP